ncbi:substrate-binding periplasmic protein [Jiangella asiatica]|uniref:Amino acid ABC transporter substrate-binding protein n=1 Tax=Jiangella asiatica TaxID=2530372 RepID=A0A4R5DD51_9ACTN|nr:ABC transporter substrate-binding protein [Jiangella asiatica]TDE08455.1 amino acid ABC transporter substrate-binding protein [Jiangella asiatica]
MGDHDQTPRRPPRRVRLTALSAAICGAALLTAAGCGDSTSSGNADYDLVGNDVVLVSTAASMPNTGMDGREFIGFEAEMLKQALDNLGLEYEVALSDFPGMLASVQSKRADIGVANIAWLESRTADGLFSDPIFYGRPVVAQTPGLGVDSVEGLKGHTVGTVSGFVSVPVLSNMEGVELRTYPDIAATLADLDAGRIDIALIDPLLTLYTHKTRPDLNFDVMPMTPPTTAEIEANPDLEVFGPHMIGWYLPEGGEELRDALNEEIRAMYENGETARLMQEHGIDAPDDLLTVSDEWQTFFTDQRHSVDRPDEWTLPLG